MKRFLIFATLLLAGTFANGAYLLWQVDTSDYGAAGVQATDAFLYANGNRIAGTSNLGTPVQVDLSGVESGASFYVELANWIGSSMNVVAQSEAVSYASLQGSLFTDDMTDVARVQAWHASGYTAVPEPTSGVLLIVGLGLLGLKRRKV